jgi:hypothetical protein
MRLIHLGGLALVGWVLTCAVSAAQSESLAPLLTGSATAVAGPVIVHTLA